MSLTDDKTHERRISVTKTEAVEWEFEMDFASNKVPATVSYTDDFTNWLSRVPKANSNHPDYNALQLVKFKGSRIDGGMIKVTLYYESNSSEANYPGREPSLVKRYSLEPADYEESLLTFHKLKDLVDASKEAIGELLASSRTKTDFQKATTAIGADPLALFAVDKIREGKEAYLNSGLMWVERFQTKNLEDLDLAQNLKIAASVPGNPPSLPAGANWLYRAGPASPNDDGESWEIEKRWMASGPGGWDTFFYGSDA